MSDAESKKQSQLEFRRIGKGGETVLVKSGRVPRVGRVLDERDCIRTSSCESVGGFLRESRVGGVAGITSWNKERNKLK